MGASNSKPQTVQMANPMAFVITRDVVERIEGTAKDSKLGTTLCEKCKQKPDLESSSGVPVTMEHSPKETRDMQPVPVAKSWKKRYMEVEETEFGKSLLRVQELFGQTVNWAKDYEGEIGKFEEELIHCYQRYPNETLQCSNLARQYHRFVFTKQNAEISKMKVDPDGSGDPRAPKSSRDTER
ncbi:uncharacterized protein LOC108141198 [Drosophila elegans]|uniref:uncharacterized protein LOC108141198 n=1 Tax=Drosophila elegans TaxID=30023 RepID=UPI0007E771DB|nr:uncharacterized protein LOC108141198 [Drosophila elegans]